ncbi:MAG: hypothetical protein ABJD68_09280 [Nakamurella sp.]
MIAALGAGAPVCVIIEVSGWVDLLIGVGLIAIPALGIPLMAWIAHRHPSGSAQRLGKRRPGVVVNRIGLAFAALGVIGLLTSDIRDTDTDQSCDAFDPIAVVATVLILVGVLLVSGGWAAAIRASWVVLATLAILDCWILAISLVYRPQEGSVNGVLFLAFGLHAGCCCVAARWMYNGQDLGPIERAKAGEAGRTLSAVWIFLASYSLLTLIRDESGVFQSAAASAVLGALTVGALAVTMGSGYTKYVEAVNAARPEPAGPPQRTQSPEPAVAPGHAETPGPADAPGPAETPGPADAPGLQRHRIQRSGRRTPQIDHE